MTRDDKQQRELPYGAAQGSFDERRLKVGMTIGAMCDSNGLLLESYAGAPVMELRVLMLLMLEAEARGRSMTPEDMIRPPWGLFCSERTVRRVLKLGLDLGILLSERRLAEDRQKFIKAWRIDWAGVKRFAATKAKPDGHGGQPLGQDDQGIGHGVQNGGHPGQSRTCNSFSSLKNSDVDDVDVFREEDRTPWPEGHEESTGHSRGVWDGPESANAQSHGGPPTVRPVSRAPHRAANLDASQLVGLVRQCRVLAAERAVQAAIGHGHDVPALVAGWRRYCDPGCDDKDYAAKRLFYRLVDPPMGLEPNQGWVPQFPNRILTLEAEEREAAKRQEEAARSAKEAATQAALEKAKAWILNCGESQQRKILAEYFAQNEGPASEVVRKAAQPLEHGFFLPWLVKRYGGANGNAN